jgi:hypothetical protein
MGKLARQTYHISPQAWTVVRKARPVPGKRLLLSKSPRRIHIWRHATPAETRTCSVVLSVDDVTFSKAGKYRFLSQFLSDPAIFVSFLQNHWDGSETAVFAFQLQPISLLIMRRRVRRRLF